MMSETRQPQRRGRPRSFLEKGKKRLQRVGQWVTWRLGVRLLALPLAVHTNRRFLAGPAAAPPELPESSWALAEQQRLLDRSEQRLQSIEGKGPGLATVGAVVAAAIAVAISLTWDDAGTLQRVLLAAAGAYALMSLAAPIKLVGPIERSTITAAQLAEISDEAHPEARLARECAQAAADNDRSTLRLSNLQAASRNDLVAATVLFVAWAVSALACT